MIDPKKLRAIDLRLRREYGITLEEYVAVLGYQKNRCAVCKRKVTEFKTRLAVDHCHTSGQLRGLLCWSCNKLVGERAIAERLIAAGKYMQNPPLVAVLGKRFTAPGRVGSKKRAKLLAAMRRSTKSKQGEHV